MNGIGLDIGTTTICGVIMNENGEVLRSVTLPNDSAVPGRYSWEKLQDPERIYQICTEVLEQLEKSGERASTLGISGQMHGILYLDKAGRAVSPLYSWQDGRGNLSCPSGETYCEQLTELTGYPMASGYGLTTHFYNMKNGLVPKDTAALCTIGDYAAMRLAGKKRPLFHKSMAASLGIYDLSEDRFDEEALKRAGIDPSLLPEVSREERFLAESREKDPSIALALGDNQASFFGAVGKDSTVLVNVGTGSQVSVYCDHLDRNLNVEFRPYIGKSWLMVGAPLCGGASYAMLEDFFSETVRAFTGRKPDEPYDVMNALAEEALKKGNCLEVDTRFRGTRQEPGLRGTVKNIGEDNFTPGGLAAGVLRGMSRELFGIYSEIPEEYKKTEVITGSGNGLRRNRVLRRIVEAMFGRPVRIPEYEEEASCGAALYAMKLLLTGTVSV